jgi:predicted lipoprotein
MNKIFKYGIGILVCLMVVYFSLDIQKLDKINATKVNTDFNAGDYASKFWEKELPGCIDKAIDIDQLAGLLKTNPQQALSDYSHQLGISHTYYFTVKGSGKILSVGEEFLEVETDLKVKVQIATAFIFGNAVRDGSGKVDIDEFINMTDFNNVSVAINKLVKERVVTPVKTSVKPGMLIQFAGAIEINGENLNLNDIRIIPVLINLKHGTTE